MPSRQSPPPFPVPCPARHILFDPLLAICEAFFSVVKRFSPPVILPPFLPAFPASSLPSVLRFPSVASGFTHRLF